MSIMLILGGSVLDEEWERTKMYFPFHKPGEPKWGLRRVGADDEIAGSWDEDKERLDLAALAPKMARALLNARKIMAFDGDEICDEIREIVKRVDTIVNASSSETSEESVSK